MSDEAWLEFVEVLSTAKVSGTASNKPSFPNNLDHEDSAIHIFFSQNNEDDYEIPFTSVVLQASLSPEFISDLKKDKCNEMNEMNDEHFNSSHGIILRLHPVLFTFLHHASRINTISGEIQFDENRNVEESFSLVTHCTSSASENCSIHVKLSPLPILPFKLLQVVAQEQQQNKQGSFWKCRSVKVERLKKGSGIFLSCIYVEDNNLHSSGVTNEGKINTMQMSLDQVIGIALEGRIVRAGCVLLLSTVCGYVIVRITKIVDIDKELTGSFDMDDMQSTRSTYRLSDDVFSCYNCHIEVPRRSPHDRNKMQMITGDMQWERDVPGYEPQLEQIIEIFSLHGDVASASGVVLTGCAGVGKSRLASCVACRYIESKSFKKFNQQEQLEEGYKANTNASTLNQKIFFSSVQDLIFQASVETNLFENILDPRLKGCKLWIIDDLNLLEAEPSNGDEAKNDAEIIMVQNALTEAIDRFHHKCCILGIAQSESLLPSELTKSGRLEKTIQMVPPTQLQRIKIWEYILSHELNGGVLTDSDPAHDGLVDTLASSTAGCVPKDMLQVYRDAQQRVGARKNSQMCGNTSALKWDDFKEAIKTSIPSQLSELDVIRPTMFDKGVSWKEIHRLSWQNFGGYSLLKRNVYRQVVVPWKFFLQTLDESSSENVIGNDKTRLEPPPGVLFHGISGTGKTTAAKCLAFSLGLPIIQIRATDLLDKWLGGSESLLRSLFMRARSVSPCILFIDEIDAIACNRETDDNNDLSSRILSTLLNEMDGVSSSIRKNRVLVIACTNRIRSIDSALLRPGRLQEHFNIERPEVADYEEILRVCLCKIPIDENFASNKLAAKLIDVKATGADVEGLCRDATFMAMRRLDSGKNDVIAVSETDFEAVIAEKFDS